MVVVKISKYIYAVKTYILPMSMVTTADSQCHSPPTAPAPPPSLLTSSRRPQCHVNIIFSWRLLTHLGGAPREAVLRVEGGAGGELAAFVSEGEQAGLTRLCQTLCSERSDSIV